MTDNKPHYTGHRARLKERLLKNNLGEAEDYEIMELLLFSIYPRRDVKPLAKEIINKFGSFAHAITASPQKLASEMNLPTSMQALFRAVHESAFRIARAECQEKPIIESWVSLLNYCRISIGRKSMEEVRILYLNKRNMLIADEVQQNGGIDYAHLDIRKVVKQCLLKDVSNIIVVHNHPTGVTKPSRNDIEVTKVLGEALKGINVKLHDHIIISEKDHFSFKASGLI